MEGWAVQGEGERAGEMGRRRDGLNGGACCCWKVVLEACMRLGVETLTNFRTCVREELMLIVKLPVGWAHWILCFFLFGCGHGISTRQASMPSVTTAATPAARQTPTQTNQGYNNNLTFACGSKGMSADFVTGNCISRSGSQVNPLNLYPPFQAPVPKPSNSELILRCQGRGVDFVTGRCM